MFLGIKEQEQKSTASVKPPCYGCEHLIASPFGCSHPNSIKVIWDPINNRSYRLPSVEMCAQKGGMCQFYDPHIHRGAEYKEVQKKKKKDAYHKKHAKDIDPVLAKAGDPSMTAEEFVKELEMLASMLEQKEKEGEEDEET